ncbi:D-alanine--D-alanine ligase family protein [uncultured Fenollaria sp.]|uniref:D-alanine--D-alanine ligase family protein n=1 Tax=uncultured Fenollaria sp. TaxID=1686315 RepID=UPI0025E5DF61|nr:D-alanine--D-alanine ligase family protein [uncultured Fenollaria sp.]
MLKVGVIFGGRSVEHEVSVITGMQVIENMDKEKFLPIPIYITKEGKWLSSEAFKNFKTFKDGDFSSAKNVMLGCDYGDFNLYINPEAKSMFDKKVYDTLDLVFFALHGTNGEDGSCQGLVETVGLPYTGTNVLSSSVGMDKVIMKDVYRANGLPVVNYRYYYRSKWRSSKEEVMADIEKNLTYPLFIKPSNLGSSIGISKVKNKDNLEEALMIAFSYDKKVIVEESVENAREINCAVMGYEENVETSELEEPLDFKELLTFDDKYVSNKKTPGTKTMRNLLKKDEPLRDELESLATKAFTSIDAAGNARVDLLVSKDTGKIYINEINTIPGSVAFYLWEPKGYSFKDLITKMLEIAQEVDTMRKETVYSYDAELFKRIQYGKKL